MLKGSYIISLSSWLETLINYVIQLAQSVEHLTFNQGVPRSSRWVDHHFFALDVCLMK